MWRFRAFPDFANVEEKFGSLACESSLGVDSKERWQDDSMQDLPKAFYSLRTALHKLEQCSSVEHADVTLQDYVYHNAMSLTLKWLPQGLVLGGHAVKRVATFRQIG